MIFLKNIKMNTKLILSFGLICVFFLASTIVSNLFLKKVQENAKEMYEVKLLSTVDALSIKSIVDSVEGELYTIMNDTNADNVKKAKESFSKKAESNNKYAKDFEVLPRTDQEEVLWQKYKDETEKYRTVRDKLFSSIDAGNRTAIDNLYKELTEVRNSRVSYINQIVEINTSGAKAYYAEILETNKTANMITIIAAIITLGASILIGLFLKKDITVPLNSIKNLSVRLSNYDFSTPIEITRSDEFADTAVSLNQAQENVKELLKGLIGDCEDLSSSSEELSAIVEELSAKTAHIDESINVIASSMQENTALSEEVNSSIEEINVHINTLAERAVEGNDNSLKSKEHATLIKQNSSQAIDSIKTIYREKQENMLKVVEKAKVIDKIKIMADTIGGISEQTNLLALNASIEAARAGEHGKGFAVVAEEVRKLSEQSASAVEGIKHTISEISTVFNASIDTGSDLLEFINSNVNQELDDYSKTGEEYYNSSDFMNKMSEQVASMSQDVRENIKTILENVKNITDANKESTSQTDSVKEGSNETTVALEQVAMTAQNQAELAQKINELIQQFKI